MQKLILLEWTSDVLFKFGVSGLWLDIFVLVVVEGLGIGVFLFEFDSDGLPEFVEVVGFDPTVH